MPRTLVPFPGLSLCSLGLFVGPRSWSCITVLRWVPVIDGETEAQKEKVNGLPGTAQEAVVH